MKRNVQVMKISGFSFARNADTLGYPLAESILSVLPICDEFIIAVGRGDEGDRTRQLVEGVGSPKIRIIETSWSDRDTLKGLIYSQQTNIALAECTGDWCFYIQADEVLHEQFLDALRRRCEELLNVKQAEGLLFGYKHFYGDYEHCQDGHRWYPFEIRIVRNGIGVASIGDAQSFRCHGKKLKVAYANAEMFHYGYVRNPRLMQRRNAEIGTTYLGAETAEKIYKSKPDIFDFGSLEKLNVFLGTHPKIMENRIRAMDWRNLLQYTGKSRTHHHHDKLKYRILTYLEKKLFGGKRIGGYKNYILLKNI
jgi:hypothetical protein